MEKHIDETKPHREPDRQAGRQIRFTGS